MPTQGERQNYLWRPNDNSVTTRMRYDLEAEHWTRAFKSSSNKGASNFGADLAVIGLVISLAINLCVMVVLLLTELVKFLYKIFNNEQQKYEANLITVNRRVSLTTTSIVDVKFTDDLFKKAAYMVVNQKVASISLLMFEFKIDFIRAFDIIEQLEKANIIKTYKKPVKRIVVQTIKSLDDYFNSKN